MAGFHNAKLWYSGKAGESSPREGRRSARARRGVPGGSVPAVGTQAGSFFDPLSMRVNAVLKDSHPDMLDAFGDLLARLHDATVEVIENIDDLVEPRIVSD